MNAPDRLEKKKISRKLEKGRVGRGGKIVDRERQREVRESVPRGGRVRDISDVLYVQRGKKGRRKQVMRGGRHVSEKKGKKKDGKGSSAS